MTGIRYRPDFELQDGHPQGPDVADLARRFVGGITCRTDEEALSVGRGAVVRALNELNLFGLRKTPPRIRVTFVPVTAPAP